MGEWTLNVGNVKVLFLTTKEGALGVKFNHSKTGGHYEYYVPTEKNTKIPLYNPKNPQQDFIDVRYTDGRNYYRADEMQRKYFDVSAPTVYITEDQMKQMYPLTKEAKAISKQPISKLNLTNISASEGYYLLPSRDYENIAKYKKLIEFLGNDFIITSPMRLRVRSVTSHNYAIYVDRAQNAVVAVEVLVKSGMQTPSVSFYSEPPFEVQEVMDEEEKEKRWKKKHGDWDKRVPEMGGYDPELDEGPYDEEATCVECGKRFQQQGDIQLCDRCQDKFDLDKLWKMHDENKLDALDFNENKSMREKFRVKK